MNNDFKVKIFADGAEIDKMKEVYEKGIVKGFTTNPSLMKKAGVKSYKEFGKQVLKEIKDMPVSFEVFSDDFSKMEKEAEEINSWGENVYVKIPVTNTKGESSIPLIERLSKKGIKVNVTAVFTLEQVEAILNVLKFGTRSIISIFAGRIADTGVNPVPLMTKAEKMCEKVKGVELLWASCRELINIIQAEQCNCGIITVTNDILKKLPKIDKDLKQYSLETVRMFFKDASSLGYSILE